MRSRLLSGPYYAKENKSFNSMKRACKTITSKGMIKFMRVPYDTLKNKQFNRMKTNIRAPTGKLR